MNGFENLELWFVTGSQHLYGEETLKQVARDSEKIANFLSESDKLSVKVVFKPVMTSADAIYNLCVEANTSKNCVGLITWMHTFSPAKMWISGLTILTKPILHLHTQFNKRLPWSEIDMDFMNLNQSAHGGREYGYILTRLRKNRKVVVGYWQDNEVLKEVDTWVRAASAWYDLQGLKVARFGDNMREVAVTEGDKVEAQIKFGYSVNGYGVGELVKFVNAVSENQINMLLEEFGDKYKNLDKILSDKASKRRLMESAKIELGLRAFLEDGNFKAFTTTFEDLHGLEQLPGMTVQRLMKDGYGFGAEGDWKTAVLVRSMKVMGQGLKGGSSFMEDYTYDFDDKGMKVLGSHMLEICESIASPNDKCSLEIHPLAIGAKDDPPRLVFNVDNGSAINASLIDMGNRFRMIVNEVEVVSPDEPLAKLPVARVVWKPKPNLKIGAAAWIYAGGAHHTGFSQSISAEHIKNFCEMADIEYLLIDDETKLDEFNKEMRWNEVYYQVSKGL